MSDPVGVISVTRDMLQGEPLQVISRLSGLSLRGRLVGWGIWRELNELFRGCSKLFHDDVSSGRYGYVGGGNQGNFVSSCTDWGGISQSRGTRWEFRFGRREWADYRSFTLWDLYDWAKRSPRAGETARGLYLASRRVSGTLGVSPRHWYGPVAISSQMMGANGVQDHMPDKEEMGIPDLARWSLFSGRMQAVRIGVSDQPAREYDINSAYAWGLSQVPSLRGASLFRGLAYSGRPWALFRVRWDIPKRPNETPIFPFPVRVSEEDGGGVEYPRTGEGWYWSPLVREAIKHWNREIEILECIGIHAPCTDMSFSFLGTQYEQRYQFDRGGVEDTILKWALSCVWGKLCQRPTPKWRSSTKCHLWAGMATSLVNAELLQVAMSDPRRVWHIHVDSILMSGDRRHVLETGEGLGQWRSKPYSEIQQYRVGVWRGRTPFGWDEKSQGIPPGCLDWEEAEREWGVFGTLGRTEIGWKEFQGFGTGDYEEWLSEKEVRLAMPLQPGKMVNLSDPKHWTRPGDRFVTWMPPDSVENPVPYGELCDEFGLDHTPSRRQERFQ